ncbi:arylsulfatase [Hyphococcus lacteus]|uniref:Arylsulfatase n=1 Tax=Hyphococcus lacteus TaxID=3143536 RepID=A0ABV3Z3I3_9PROT
MSRCSIGKLAFLMSTAIIMVSSAAAAEQEARSPEAKHQWQHYPSPPTAPKDAPNVLIIMTDDVGFGASSTFGGIVPTPNLDRLAKNGLRYNRFHTTAMCSPTRAALLTGRNHHAVNTGAINDLSLDRDGYTSVIPESAATIGDILGLNGYDTAWIGKNHNTPVWENTPMGPFDRWPNGLGFDYFYGYNLSYMDQFAPTLIENRNQVELHPSKNYSLERDFADHAIDWLRQQNTYAPDTPFLLYYSTATAHAPIQAPDEWLERFRGQFDDGWDVMRERIFAQQQSTKNVPTSAKLTSRPPQIPAWSSRTPEQQKFDARIMEAYAAMLAYCDEQIGRILDELEQAGELDNTLVIFIQGDNGAATETLDGALNEIAMFASIDTSEIDMEKNIDLIGTAKSQPVLPTGWAWALNTPFQWGKQYASHFGGTRNGLVISWPKYIKAKGELRSQFHNITDIAPTIFEAIGIKPAKKVQGVKQQPIDGTSMMYSFNSADAKDQRNEQYFEIMGNRAFYKDGWMASTTPRRLPGYGYISEDYSWELYNVDEDFSQDKNLATEMPKKLSSLRKDFTDVATKNSVLPISDEFLPRFSPDKRPNAFEGRDKVVFYPRTTAYSGTAFPSLYSDWTVDAKVTVSNQAESAPIITRGNRFGGWGLFIDDGKPLLVYRASHLEKDIITITSPDTLAPGDHSISVQLERTPEDKMNHLSLIIDGKIIATQQVSQLAHPGVETFIGRLSAIELIEDLQIPYSTPGVVQSIKVSF